MALHSSLGMFTTLILYILLFRAQIRELLKNRLHLNDILKIFKTFQINDIFLVGYFNVISDPNLEGRGGVTILKLKNDSKNSSDK